MKKVRSKRMPAKKAAPKKADKKAAAPAKKAEAKKAAAKDKLWAKMKAPAKERAGSIEEAIKEAVAIEAVNKHAVDVGMNALFAFREEFDPTWLQYGRFQHVLTHTIKMWNFVEKPE